MSKTQEMKSVDMKTSSALYKSGLDTNLTKQAVDKKPQEVMIAVKSCRGDSKYIE